MVPDRRCLAEDRQNAWTPSPAISKCWPVSRPTICTIFAQRGLVQAQLELKHYLEARDAALALAKIAPDDKGQAEAQMYLGEAYFDNQQLPEAQACYQKIVTAYPNSTLAPYALMRSAWIAEKKKDLPLAVNSYRDFLAKFSDDPQVPQAFYRLGVDLADSKDFEGAIHAFQNVPKTCKFADEAAYAIAWAYRDQEKADEANAQFAAVAEGFPNSPLATDSLFRLGEYWLEKKNYTQAMLFYSRAADAEKTTQGKLGELILYKLGVCAFHAERYEVAANAFDKVANLYKDGQYESDSLYWRGQSLEKLAQALAETGTIYRCARGLCAICGAICQTAVDARCRGRRGPLCTARQAVCRCTRGFTKSAATVHRGQQRHG